MIGSTIHRHGSCCTEGRKAVLCEVFLDGFWERSVKEKFPAYEFFAISAFCIRLSWNFMDCILWNCHWSFELSRSVDSLVAQDAIRGAQEQTSCNWFTIFLAPLLTKMRCIFEQHCNRRWYLNMAYHAWTETRGLIVQIHQFADIQQLSSQQSR